MLANIKTRERSIGSIKTIDRASVMTQHIRQANLKIKDASAADRHDSDNPENYKSLKSAKQEHEECSGSI